jgi:DnaK suppressor protein
MTGTITPTTNSRLPSLTASLPDLRARLEEQRRFRIEQLAALETARENGAAHPDPADAHREITDTLTVAARQALDDIETALRRMHAGQYGTCHRCGGAIPLEHLQALPQVRLCTPCGNPRTRQQP